MAFLQQSFCKILYFSFTCDNDATKQAASFICWRYAELNVTEFFTLHNDEQNQEDSTFFQEGNHPFKKYVIFICRLWVK